jgi:DNA-binding NarL/FixJ family response regulator
MENDIILSKREQEVLTFVTQGITNKEIATNLYISEHAVNVYLRSIMGKLHTH